LIDYLGNLKINGEKLALANTFSFRRNDMQALKKRVFAIVGVMIFCVTVLSSPAMARDPFASGSGEMMAFDLAVLRPLGLVATTLGCVFYVASLPFTAWSQESLHKAGQNFVVEPGTYTFVRPLGEVKSVPVGD
jgi:hypothetical protein